MGQTIRYLDHMGSVRLYFDCSGNNGDKVGDDNCCGAPGKIGRPGHICPKTAPICTGYESGTWGTCHAKIQIDSATV